MARPKRQVEAPVEEPAAQPPTERVAAPVQYIPRPPQAPRQMRVERQGAEGSAYSQRFPQIRAGICEYCGVLDSGTPSQFQYKLCPHFRGMQARCTYCPESKDPDDVIYHEVLNVAEHPDKPGILVMWCGSYSCSQKHTQRFKQTVN